MAKTTKKPVKKSKSLKAQKKLNWKVVALMIFAAALAGGFMVFQSFANSKVTFTRYADEMTGGYKDRLFNNKTRSASSPIYSQITFKEAVASRVVCVHYGVEVPAPANGIGFEVEVLDSYKKSTGISQRFSISGKAKGTTDNACLKLIQPATSDTPEQTFRDAGFVKIQMVGRGGILVDKVWGKK